MRIIPDYGRPVVKSKVAAILLWVIGYFGMLNLHNFYLGKIKYALIKLAALAAFVILVRLSVGRDESIALFATLYTIIVGVLLVFGIIEIVQIGRKMPRYGWSSMQVHAYEASARGDGAQRSAGAPIAARRQSLLNVIVCAVVGTGLIIGGLSGTMVLRGTDSSEALAALGGAFLIWTVVSIIRYIRQKIAMKNAPVFAGRATCAICGHSLEPGSVFCAKCGARVADVSWEG